MVAQIFGDTLSRLYNECNITGALRLEAMRRQRNAHRCDHTPFKVVDRRGNATQTDRNFLLITGIAALPHLIQVS